jgi:hypothetical protein
METKCQLYRRRNRHLQGFYRDRRGRRAAEITVDTGRFGDDARGAPGGSPSIRPD